LKRFSLTSFSKLVNIAFHAALMAAVALMTAACVNNAKDTGPVPAELQGTWIGSGDSGNGKTLTFTADVFTYAKDNSYTVGNLTFRKVNNDNPSTKGTYPSGYRFEGTYTAGTGNFVQHIGEKSEEDPVFLNTAKTALCWGSDENSQNWIFTKK
jgi:hypothetical protein